MKKKKILALCITVALSVGLLAGCGYAGNAATEESASASISTEDERTDVASESSAEGTEYKYGSVTIPALDGSLCGAPLYIAYEKGFFAKPGFDVTLTAADFETKKIGLNNGTIPLVNGDFQFFASAEQGINMKVVSGMHKGCIKIVVRQDSDIKSPEDLIGKKIAVDEIGGTTYQVASVWLEEGGVSALQSDGKVSFLPYSDGNLELQALYDGEIDAAAVWDPLGDIAVASGKAKVLLDIASDEPFAGKYCCFYYASEKVLEENPEEIKDLLLALDDAQKWINNNREEALKIIVDGGYSEVEDVELAAQLLDDYDYDCCDGSLNDDVSEDVKYFAEKLHEIGYLESDPDEFAANLYQPISQDNSENMENSKASSEDPGDSADKSWDELVDVNWEENSTDLETGINMTYLTLGPEDGKPIVLIHGATDSRISWSQVAPKLAEQGYRVYVPELRGHGKTDKPKEDAYTLDEHESDILALINVLGLKKVNIVGHSLGTFIAEKLAIDYPELVSSITLIGAGYKVEHNEVIDWVLNGDGEGFDGVTAYKDGGEIPDDFIREWTSTVNEDKNFADAIYLQAKNLPNYAWAAIFNGLNGTNLSGELDKITAPVLIIWGSEDIVFPENEQKELQSYLTNAEKVDFVTIDGADHNTHWASDEVAGRIANLIGKEAL